MQGSGRILAGRPGRPLSPAGATVLAALLLAGAALQARAQGIFPSGTVTGRVLAEDTERPIRLARVVLRSVNAVTEADDDRPVGPRGGGGSGTQADVEGNFVLSGVAPGDYYVLATAPGFLSPQAQLAAAAAAGAKPADLLAHLPVVHVSGNGSSAATVTLEHGATLAGHLSWGDGGVAGNVVVQAVNADASAGSLPQGLEGLQLPGNSNTATTDDRGDFRIAGLAPGAYLVRVVLGSPRGGRGNGNSVPLHLFFPGVFRRGEAKAITLRAGEERSDLQLTLDLTQLHSVSGSVRGGNANLAVSSGRVTLQDENDPDLTRTGTVTAGGEFLVPYVPTGSYTLTVEAGGGGNGRGSTTASFKPFSESVTVATTDITDLALTLAPAGSAQ